MRWPHFQKMGFLYENAIKVLIKERAYVSKRYFIRVVVFSFFNTLRTAHCQTESLIITSFKKNKFAKWLRR